MTRHRVALRRQQTDITEIKGYIPDKYFSCKVTKTNHRDSLALSRRTIVTLTFSFRLSNFLHLSTLFSPSPPSSFPRRLPLQLKVIDSLKLWANNKMDTAWPGAYYTQVMDSVGVLNDIAQRLDDEGWSDLWATQRAPRPSSLSHTYTHCNPVLFISSLIRKQMRHGCIYGEDVHKN